MYCKHCYRLVEEGTEICPACGKRQHKKSIPIAPIFIVSACAALLVIAMVFFIRPWKEAPSQDTELDYSGRELQVGSICFDLDNVIDVQLVEKDENFQSYLFTLIEDTAMISVFATDISWQTTNEGYTFEEYQREQNEAFYEGLYPLVDSACTFAGIPIVFKSYGDVAEDGSAVLKMTGTFEFRGYVFTFNNIFKEEQETALDMFSELLSSSAELTMRLYPEELEKSK